MDPLCVNLNGGDSQDVATATTQIITLTHDTSTWSQWHHHTLSLSYIIEMTIQSVITLDKSEDSIVKPMSKS